VIFAILVPVKRREAADDKEMTALHPHTRISINPAEVKGGMVDFFTIFGTIIRLHLG